MTRSFKVIVKKYQQGYVAQAVGCGGAVMGEGNTREEALADVASAIRTTLETLGERSFDAEFPVLDVSVAEVHA